MWIKCIELMNFKAYQQQHFTFPKPELGRNLVLIGGMNGFGKTTLLESLYLCLYGQDAIIHLERAGLQDNSYAKFLQGALHGKANTIKRDQMSVSISLMLNNTNGFKITRKWFFDTKGKYLEDDLVLEEIKNNINQPWDKEYLRFVLEEHAVPADLAPFFFFDGEEVKKLANQNREGWIKKGMESLMGVVLLRALIGRLKDYQSKKRLSGHNVDETKLDALESSLKINKRQFAKLKDELSDIDFNIQQKQARRDELQNELRSLTIGSDSVKDIEDVLKEEAEKRQLLKNCEKQLESILADKLPFHLISSLLLGNLNQRLLSEKIKIEWDLQKTELEPRKLKFKVAFFNTKFMQQFTTRYESMKLTLEDCITEAWETLYFPRPEGCATELLHDYLESKQRQRLKESFNDIQIGAKEIRDLVTQKRMIEQKLRGLELSRIKLDGIDKDGVLKKINQELADVQQKLDSENRKLGDLNRQLISLKAEIEREQATYEREKGYLIQSEPAKSAANKAQKVVRLIDELIPRLFELKINEVSQATTRYYKQFAHKQQITNIVIQENGNHSFFSDDNSEIKFDRSAGENEIFVTALFAGLAEASGYKIPLVIDTPLARLDSQHRNNLLKYWCSDANRQVILLSQDKEIDAEMKQQMQSHLSKTYLLESTAIGEGIYKTTAKENCYFGENYEWN